MKTAATLSVSVILLVLAFSTLAVGSNNNAPLARTLTGVVTDRAGKPLGDAIVYLKDTKTLAVKSYITRNDGAYRFPALSPNIDYEVYAQVNGHKSDTKTLSSFDSRPQAVINLKINTR